MKNPKLNYKDCSTDTLFRTRYQADKAKRMSYWLNSDMVTVKVDGGYKVMDASDYRIWRKQR